MLTLTEISKSFGARTLLENASLQINRGDRIGLVGPNGAGKTTLFSIILGEASPDSGSILVEKNIHLGHLPQESAPVGDETVLELTTAITPELGELRRKLRGLDEAGASDTDEFHDLHDRFLELDGYTRDPLAKRILNGLAFRDSDIDRPAREMSGGWVMRAHLARLLVMEPDLLLLDEPTNHLDLESLIWFQNYLKEYPGAIFMISHDREFLNQLTQSIVDIRHGQLQRYRGNYEDYLIQREARDSQQLSAHKNQQKRIASLQKFVDRFGAKASMASRAQNKLKQIDRMEVIDAPQKEDRKIKFRFPQPPRGGQRVITLTDIHQAYGDHVVYQGIQFEAERGQRMVLVGPNGAGKSTLLKILAGVVPFHRGERSLGHQIQPGYYSQYRIDMLKPDRSVLEEALDTPVQISEQTVRTVLGSFLFRGDDVFKKVGVLSGGEKSRLALVKLLLSPPNLLLMDEPTTHLDMSSIDALIEALRQYEGTLIFISHDVHFIRAIAQEVLHIHSGKLNLYKGNYQYYLDKTQSSNARSALTAGAVTTTHSPVTKGDQSPIKAKSKEQKRQEAQERQARYQEKKDRESRMSIIETEIDKHEMRQKDITQILEDPASYRNPAVHVVELNRELENIILSLQHLNDEWESLATQSRIE